jgi:CheY-like chemotaxis protein
MLRAEPRTSHIPVVAMTALPLHGREDWLSDAGFADYVVKPIDIEEFPDVIRRLCARTPE